MGHGGSGSRGHRVPQSVIPEHLALGIPGDPSSYSAPRSSSLTQEHSSMCVCGGAGLAHPQAGCPYSLYLKVTHRAESVVYNEKALEEVPEMSMSQTWGMSCTGPPAQDHVFLASPYLGSLQPQLSSVETKNLSLKSSREDGCRAFNFRQGNRPRANNSAPQGWLSFLDYLSCLYPSIA